MVSAGRISLVRWSGEQLQSGPAGPPAVIDPYAALPQDRRPATATLPPVRTATWTGPVVHIDHPVAELVPSWSADTPARSWITVEAKVGAGAEQWSPWLVLAHWCLRDPDDPVEPGALHRTSVPGQTGPLARVATDTVLAAEGAPFDRWQLRVHLRAPEGEALPTLHAVSALASTPAEVSGGHPGADQTPPVRRPAVIELTPLPQHAHAGHYPQWDGGGRSWCSPTAISMVLRHWGVGPSADETAWVDGHEGDADVDHAARAAYDLAYGGAGNWAFGAAYAASRGLDAVVTRLRGVAEAELFAWTGIPLVASVAFTADELPEAGYATTGHLLVIAGVTETGDVVCFDPAAHDTSDPAQVRTTYPRARFERAWQGGSGGIVTIIRPRHVALPPAPPGAGWG